MPNLHFLLIAGFQALRNQVIRNIIGDSNLSMINFLPQIIDSLNQHLPLATIMLKLVFEFRCFEQLLFEIELPVEISPVVAKSRPDIIDSVPEAIKFFAGDG